MDLERRIAEHRHGKIKGFASRYNVCKLVWVERFAHVDDAIACEKKIKAWRRAKKDELVESINPGWRDLAAGWYGA